MTSNATRTELLNALEELGALFPDWRLGQTLANLAMAAGHPESGAIWDFEDSEALIAARRLIERNSQRNSKEPNHKLQQAAAS